MYVFPKKQIFPIILPTPVFKSRFGISKNFVEMNPSLYIDTNGNTQILVRCVDYTKYRGNNFTLYNPKSNSLYYKLTGKITENLSLDSFRVEEVTVDYNLPKHTTYWIGLEDIRFIDASNILVTVPELNESGLPCIFRAVLNGSTISSFVKCEPSKTEKNWMPFLDKVLYSVHPFQIKSIDTNDITEINLPNNYVLEGYHGSSNGIPYLNGILFLIHKNEDVVKHRWILFNPALNKVKVSEPFVFFSHSFIEFSCSIARYQDHIYVSLGVNDDKAFILKVSTYDIEASFVGNTLLRWDD